MPTAVQPEAWHLDKKVPIALIITLVLQAAAFIWWAASQSALINLHERRLDTAERRIDSGDGRSQVLSEKIVRIEANTESIVSSINRIERVVTPPR
jgi:hypothetical protein